MSPLSNTFIYSSQAVPCKSEVPRTRAVVTLLRMAICHVVVQTTLCDDMLYSTETMGFTPTSPAPQHKTHFCWILQNEKRQATVWVETK